jgi:hypothetical protein
MTPQPSKWLQMTIKEINQQRHRFQRAPGTTPSSEELPLLEKQALVDEIFRGMPIRYIEYYERSGLGEKVYLVTKGWPQLCAIFDFLDDKFPTWTDEERRQWEQSHTSHE